MKICMGNEVHARAGGMPASFLCMYSQVIAVNSVSGHIQEGKGVGGGLHSFPQCLFSAGTLAPTKYIQESRDQ